MNPDYMKMPHTSLSFSCQMNLEVLFIKCQQTLNLYHLILKEGMTLNLNKFYFPKISFLLSLVEIDMEKMKMWSLQGRRRLRLRQRQRQTMHKFWYVKLNWAFCLGVKILMALSKSYKTWFSLIKWRTIWIQKYKVIYKTQILRNSKH